MVDNFTDHYGFQKLGAGEPFSKNSYKFTQSDRDLLDRLLYLGAEGHHHVGGTSVAETPVLAPRLQIDTRGGSMPPATRFAYKYTLIDPQGFESAASPEAFMNTPSAVQTPGASIDIAFLDTGGSLPPGNYYYVLSAYTRFNSQETIADNAAFIQVPYVTSTNKITFTLPTLPAGADGFNVYRRTPSGVAYFHVAVIDMTVTTPPLVFTDNGALSEDCDRMAPQVNTALSRNAISVAVPGVTPSIPVGYSWRIYRTSTPDLYDNSLLTTITDGSLTYLDTGTSTTAGQPPTVGVSPGAPERIDFTDGREVKGRLPLAMISAFPHEIPFSFPGSVQPVTGMQTWVCPFPQATVFCVRAVLGRDQVAVGQVLVNVVVKQSGGGTWLNVLPSPAAIVDGENGVLVDVMAIPELQAGDLLAVDVVASDSANANLSVVIGLYAYGFSVPTSHIWAVLR